MSNKCVLYSACAPLFGGICLSNHIILFSIVMKTTIAATRVAEPLLSPKGLKIELKAFMD